MSRPEPKRRSDTRRRVAVCAGWLSLCSAACVGAAEPRSSPVGMSAVMQQLVLPGSELEAVPTTDDSAIVLRIDAVYPHGSDFRYDLTYYGVEPGEYDLRQFLRRKDGSSTDALPATPLRITGELPPGQVEPQGLDSGVLPWLGGYRWIAMTVGIAWLIAGYWLLFPKREPSAHTAAAPPPTSLADRLRPLVQAAMSGQLPPAQLAELERLLVMYWRRRLQLESAPPAAALTELRAHAEAGPLVSQLEVWLHHPPGRQTVDVEALLKPYRNIESTALAELPKPAAEVRS